MAGIRYNIASGAITARATRYLREHGEDSHTLT